MANAKKKTTARKTTKPVKKTTKKAEPKVVKNLKEVKPRNNFLDEIKLSESYVSLALGIVVVLILSAIFFLFVKGISFNTNSELTNTKPLPTQTTVQNQRTYTLGEGEGLWDVAVKFYGDGYKWVDIAKANNLTEEQANQLGPGTKIIVPNIK